MPTTGKIDSAIQYPNVGVRDVLRSFWGSARKYQRSLSIILSGLVLGNVAWVMVPIYYRHFFNALEATGADRGAVAPDLLRTISVIAALNVIGWVGWRLASFASNYFQTDAIADLKRGAYRRLIRHSHRFFINNFTGALVQRVNRYARAFERIADRLTWNIIPLGIRIAGSLVVLWLTRPSIMFVVAGYLAVFIAFNYFYSRWKLKYDLRMAETDSRTTAVLADTITNQTNIQLFSGYQAESRNFRDATEEQRSVTRTSWTLNSIADSIQGFVMLTIEFVLFYLGVGYWRSGALTVGDFVLIQVYVLMLGHSLWDFSLIIRDIYQSYADAKEMVEINELPTEVEDVPGAAPLSVTDGTIAFQDVTFAFVPGRSVLTRISLNVAAGEKIALVGPSGAGKSTLVKLLLRLFDPTEGALLIDGQDITRVTQESLMDSISLVPQDPVLFHRTLADNIRYGRRDASEEEVAKAGALSHCDEFVARLSHGYETFVGERGVKLSGGERQRVAIARAILKNAPILVLDEATSSLDSHSELLIQRALANLMERKTTIVIAHRLSTIRKMDRVVVLEAGRIIETGTHDELANKSGSLYQRLWSLQAGGFLQ